MQLVRLAELMFICTSPEAKHLRATVPSEIAPCVPITLPSQKAIFPAAADRYVDALVKTGTEAPFLFNLAPIVPIIPADALMVFLGANCILKSTDVRLSELVYKVTQLVESLALKSISTDLSLCKREGYVFKSPVIAPPLKEDETSKVVALPRPHLGD